MQYNKLYIYVVFFAPLIVIATLNKKVKQQNTPLKEVSQNVRNTPSGSSALKTLHYLQDLQTHIKREQIEQQPVETNETDTEVDCAK